MHAGGYHVSKSCHFTGFSLPVKLHFLKRRRSCSEPLFLSRRILSRSSRASPRAVEANSTRDDTIHCGGTPRTLPSLPESKKLENKLAQRRAKSDDKQRLGLYPSTLRGCVLRRSLPLEAGLFMEISREIE